MTSPTALPTALLTQLSALTRPAGAAYLLPSIVLTALGHSHLLPSIYTHFTSSLPPSPASRSSSPLLVSNDPIPRRIVYREIKEALTKSAVLVGVPRVIEALLELKDAIGEGERDDSFVRQRLVDRNGAEAMKSGEEGLERIYQKDLLAIWDKMDPDLLDIQFLSKHSTYGTFLTPFGNEATETNPDPLARDPALLSIVTLSALIPQRTPREILWHLRGAIRQGLTRLEIEEIHKAIEAVCEFVGVKEVGKGMPRVADVEKQACEE